MSMLKNTYIPYILPKIAYVTTDFLVNSQYHKVMISSSIKYNLHARALWRMVQEASQMSIFARLINVAVSQHTTKHTVNHSL